MFPLLPAKLKEAWWCRREDLPYQDSTARARILVHGRLRSAQPVADSRQSRRFQSRHQRGSPRHHRRRDQGDSAFTLFGNARSGWHGGAIASSAYQCITRPTQHSGHLCASISPLDPSGWVRVGLDQSTVAPVQTVQAMPVVDAQPTFISQPLTAPQPMAVYPTVAGQP